jgi:hypothetical protein
MQKINEENKQQILAFTCLVIKTVYESILHFTINFVLQFCFL